MNFYVARNEDIRVEYNADGLSLIHIYVYKRQVLQGREHRRNR